MSALADQSHDPVNVAPSQTVVTLKEGECTCTLTSASDGDGEIYVMNANGTNLRKVTDNAAEDAEPGWAGGGRIIFASDLDGDFEIYTIRTTGTDLVKLTDNGWEDRQPRWRPE